MLYGTPSRTTADGGNSLLVKAVGATGQHRHPPLIPRPRAARSRFGPPGARNSAPLSPRRVPISHHPALGNDLPAAGRYVGSPSARRIVHEPQRTAHMLTKGLAILIILGVTSMVGFLILSDAKRGRMAEASITPAARADRLTSRALDPAPLTVAEVFPPALSPVGSSAPYRLVSRNVDPRCPVATTGALGHVLTEHGCSQVVRAALSAPYGGYRVTAGLFNLADAAGAQQVDSEVRQLVETGDGSFATVDPAQSGHTQTATLGAQVGWHATGHYLLYCVISLPDGNVVAADDPTAARITAELVDSYLTESVLAPRAPKT